MEFRILGPLEVLDGGAVVRLAGAKQRAVLGLLLIHANEVVSSDRLIDELWGEGVPETGANALQARVSKLRKVLASAGGEILLTRPPGYLLRVEPGQLDVERFERLTAEGRRALAAGHVETAAGQLREALALWRGPALADFTYEPFAQGEIVRLEEARLAALEERLEADLALGRHTELAGELEALVTAHPLRERLRGQLMLALYRSGRQAEALEAYQETRRVLVEELGIEPSPPLRELHAAILNQDAALELRIEPPELPPSPLVPAPSAPPSEERKVVTLLFADLVGSTELGGRQDPERTRARVERFYDAAAAEIEVAGGTVEKFVGDAVMAAFGAPAAQEDHAERALHAALAVRKRLEERFGDPLLLRIGVDTGEVVVGRAREGSSFVTGDAVNVAARLEQAAEPGQILVGERTVAAVRGAFEFAERAIVGAKGKPEGLACRRLVRALSLARPRGVGGLRRAFVGRQSELDLLWATYRRLLGEREPHLVTIMGDAGVGKTRLVRELWESLGSESPEPLRRTGRCLPYGRGITYWPLGEVLKEHLGILESDPPETVRRRLGAREILGLTLGLDVAGDLHPLAAREQLHQAWVGWLEELVADRPAVVLVEDLHWAEEPLLDLLDRLLRDVQGHLLLIGTARPELLDRRPAWGGGRRNATTLWLEPLPLDEAARMLDALLGTKLPPPVRELVVERAEGNPFFVEELIGTLIDQGVLERANGGWVAGELPADFAVPDSVQAVLASRIDLLAPVEKAALQAASVIGRIFWAGPVQELLEGAEPDFAMLEERDFIRRRSGSSLAGEREFAIKHALTREVAYANLPRARRARLHAAFADWLERAGEGRGESVPFLAHHYAEAVRPEDLDLAWAGDEGEYERLREKAFAWLRRAANLAVARYAIEEALALLRRALELEPSGEAQAELFHAIGRASALKYDGEGFWTAMEQAISLSTDRSVLAGLYGELAAETAARQGMWKRSPDGQVLKGWIERALKLADAESTARAQALIAKAYWDPWGEAKAAQEASALAERIGTAELRSWALMALVMANVAHQRCADALVVANRCLELLDEVSSPEYRGDIHWGAMHANLACGRMADARRHGGLLDEFERRLSPHHAVHAVGLPMMVEELHGRWETIRELTARTEQAVAENVDTPCALSARSLLVCALAVAHAGDEAEARRLEESADALGMEGYGMWIDAPRVRLALMRGELDTVERLLAGWTTGMGYGELPALSARLDAHAALRDRERLELEAPPLLQPDTYLEPFALRALGIVREDEKLVERALARFEAMGLEWHAGETRAVLAGEVRR